MGECKAIIEDIEKAIKSYFDNPNRQAYNMAFNLITNAYLNGIIDKEEKGNYYCQIWR